MSLNTDRAPMNRQSLNESGHPLSRRQGSRLNRRRSDYLPAALLICRDSV